MNDVTQNGLASVGVYGVVASMSNYSQELSLALTGIVMGLICYWYRLNEQSRDLMVSEMFMVMIYSACVMLAVFYLLEAIVGSTLPNYTINPLFFGAIAALSAANSLKVVKYATSIFKQKMEGGLK